MDRIILNYPLKINFFRLQYQFVYNTNLQIMSIAVLKYRK